MMLNIIPFVQLRDDCKSATGQILGHDLTLDAHVLGQKLRSRFQKITHPPHPGRLLQYTIPTGILRALAVLQCRAKEQSTASNGDWGAHVHVSTTLCSFRYQDIHGWMQIMEEEEQKSTHRLNFLSLTSTESMIQQILPYLEDDPP